MDSHIANSFVSVSYPLKSRGKKGRGEIVKHMEVIILSLLCCCLTCCGDKAVMSHPGTVLSQSGGWQAEEGYD